MATILSDDGHDVTIVLPWTDEPDIQKSEKYSLLFYNTSMSRQQEQAVYADVTETSAGDLAAGQVPPSVGMLFGERCRTLLFDKHVQARIADLKPQLAIVNGAMACVSAHLVHIGVPFIEYCSFPLIHMLCGHHHGVPAPPSFVPDGFFSPDVHKSFFGRVLNTLVYMFGPKLMSLFLFQHTEALVARYLAEHGLPHKDLYTLRSEASFVLVNGDTTFESIRPILPKVVYVGGIQCATAKPLQGELAEFVGGSGSGGIIVFSIGGVIESVPHQFLEMFMEIFRELPQRVVWKLKNVPPHLRQRASKNIKFMEWLPQQDLVGHPSTQLFITHGGIQGSFESICHGVPTLGIDFNLDQVSNIMILVSKGMALHAGNSKTLQKEDVERKIVQLITDSSYKENAVKARTLFFDKQRTPAQRLCYAVNYTLRHNGARHLTSKAALEMNWFQYHSVDVILFNFVVVSVAAIFIYYFLKFCFGKCYRRCFGLRRAKLD